MKIRSLFLLLLSLTILMLPSCIQYTPQEPLGTDTLPQTDSTLAATSPETEAPTDAPKPPPSLPLWDAEETLAAAKTVLRAPKSGIVDVSKQKYTYTEMQEDLRLLAQI